MIFRRSLIGMVHLEAMPGTPNWKGGSVDEIIRRAVADARMLRNSGFGVLLLENMHDRPYLKGQVGPEVTAVMTMAAAAVKEACQLPMGIQVLAAANREALAVALAVGLDFVRAEGFVFAHVADEGIIDGGAAELLRYRRQIGAEHVQVLVDIKKKHAAHALTADVDIAETARAAEFFLADGLIVTGSRTGVKPDLSEVRQVREVTRLPVLAGSGVTAENVGRFLAVCDGVIVGSSIKVEGNWANAVDAAKAAELVKSAAG